ncbi:hypothetical protein PHSC3_000422 [Chlamydiales bacterium STE3]|nr:hypothetical protein PHSC3_000422 [Chlamydiales bacterium STE3]
MLKPENKVKLAAILKSHIVPDKISLKDLKTANGTELDIVVDGNDLKVNNAKFVKKGTV